MYPFQATIIDKNQKKKVALDYDMRLVYKMSSEFRYIVRFTSVPPAIDGYLQALRQHAAKPATGE
jgi:hypothetical protein